MFTKRNSTRSMLYNILMNSRSNDLSIRRAVGKDLGDTLRVTLEKDDTIRELKIPSEIEQALKEHNVLETFSQQPDYLKREQLNKIELAKKEETRLNRLHKLIHELENK